VIQSPTAAVNLADSLSPTAAGNGGNATGAGTTAAAADLQRRDTVVSRSADRAALSHTESRARRDPAKAAELGLRSGPAVGGHEDVAQVSLSNPQAAAEALLPKFGFSPSQMSCLIPLWMGESGWRWNAENASSGAYGIPQALPGTKMASAGADWRTNPITQITWGLTYIKDSYGSPCGAWSFKQGHGWY
jgi:hypothetical protein